MKLLKSALKWLAVTIGLIITLLYIFDYGYIIRGARIVYFTGHKTVFIDDYPYFSMIRGQHVDLTILGAMEVAENGDIANYVFIEPIPFDD